VPANRMRAPKDPPAKDVEWAGRASPRMVRPVRADRSRLRPVIAVAPAPPWQGARTAPVAPAARGRRLAAALGHRLLLMSTALVSSARSD
jgi:hypothetical protein